MKNSLKVLVTITILVICLASPCIYAQTDTGLKALLKGCLNQNPELEAAYHSWQAARETVTGKTSLPDPVVEFRHNLEPVQTRTGEQN